MKICADPECNTLIPEGKTRCPKCGKKKFTDSPDAAGASAPSPAPEPAPPPPEPEPPKEKPKKKEKRVSERVKHEEPEPKPEEKAPEPVVEAKAEEKKSEPVAAAARVDEGPAANAAGGQGGHDVDHCPRCARLRSALRDARRRIKTLGQENRTLREELLSAGEMIENLAMDIEKPALEAE